MHTKNPNNLAQDLYRKAVIHRRPAWRHRAQGNCQESPDQGKGRGAPKDQRQKLESLCLLTVKDLCRKPEESTLEPEIDAPKQRRKPELPRGAQQPPPVTARTRAPPRTGIAGFLSGKSTTAKLLPGNQQPAIFPFSFFFFVIPAAILPWLFRAQNKAESVQRAFPLRLPFNQSTIANFQN